MYRLPEPTCNILLAVSLVTQTVTPCDTIAKWSYRNRIWSMNDRFIIHLWHLQWQLHFHWWKFWMIQDLVLTHISWRHHQLVWSKLSENQQHQRDLVLINIVIGCIHFCNDNILVRWEMVTKFIVNWNKRFTMTAPWGIELDQNILKIR